MKLKEQVCSLKLAKELKELEVEQESLFYWCEYAKVWVLVYRDNIAEGLSDTDKISAFTGAELWEMIKKCPGISRNILDGMWTAFFTCDTSTDEGNIHRTEADMRAMALAMHLWPARGGRPESKGDY